MSVVPFIVGPTGIGKTELAIKIADKLPVEIVSADSRQIYRLLDVGTAKPSEHILETIPHHFINFLRPDEYFSAGMFSKVARKVIRQIQGRNKVPLVVGGSGLYITALIDGLSDIDVRNEKIRQSLRHRMLDEGVEKLHAELEKIDPIWAKKIQTNDKQRVLRGLEVYLVTGKKISELQEGKSTAARFTPLIFGLISNRELLYNRINTRVERMLDHGLLSEVANLKLQGFAKTLNALNTVGYKEVFEYLEEKISYDTMIEQIKRNSRKYAKRQLTWFHRDSRIEWLHVENETDLSTFADQIIKKYKSKTVAKK